MDLAAVGERPEISDLKRSRLDVALEISAALMLLTSWGIGLLYYGVLPAAISGHFNLPKDPDELVVIEPLMATFLYFVLTGCSVFMSPRLYNYPIKITESNARVQYTLARQTMSLMKVWVMGLFASLTLDLGWLILPWLLPIFTTMKIYVVRARRAQ